MEQGKRNRNKTWQRKESNGREFGEKMMEKGKESAKENRYGFHVLSCRRAEIGSCRSGYNTDSTFPTPSQMKTMVTN